MWANFWDEIGNTVAEFVQTPETAQYNPSRAGGRPARSFTLRRLRFRSATGVDFYEFALRCTDTRHRRHGGQRQLVARGRETMGQRYERLSVD